MKHRRHPGVESKWKKREIENHLLYVVDGWVNDNFRCGRTIVRVDGEREFKRVWKPADRIFYAGDMLRIWDKFSIWTRNERRRMSMFKRLISTAWSAILIRVTAFAASTFDAPCALLMCLFPIRLLLLLSYGGSCSLLRLRVSCRNGFVVVYCLILDVWLRLLLLGISSHTVTDIHREEEKKVGCDRHREKLGRERQKYMWHSDAMRGFSDLIFTDENRAETQQPTSSFWIDFPALRTCSLSR